MCPLRTTSLVIVENSSYFNISLHLFQVYNGMLAVLILKYMYTLYTYIYICIIYNLINIIDITVTETHKETLLLMQWWRLTDYPEKFSWLASSLHILPALGSFSNSLEGRN